MIQISVQNHPRGVFRGPRGDITAYVVMTEDAVRGEFWTIYEDNDFKSYYGVCSDDLQETEKYQTSAEVIVALASEWIDRELPNPWGQ